ncbi:MAG: chromate efflux transporter [Pseudomonadota bacterium]
MTDRSDLQPPAFSEALGVYAKIGLLSFGGPAGQIALMQSEIVERRGWLAGASFDRGLAFSMMLPGPEAQQLATWIGWRLHGLSGGLAAGLAFVLPGAALMILLAWAAAQHGEVPWVAAFFAGIQPVAIAIVIGAMRKIAGRALAGPAPIALAVAAFVAIYFLGAPFPLIVGLAALAGLVITSDIQETKLEGSVAGLARHAIVTAIAWSVGVVGLFALVRLALGPGPFDDVAELFTTAAFVTFGGAYAVLPFVADQSVGTYQWLTVEQMLNGLAIAEATPGPLILVNTYAGFFAGWTDTGMVVTAITTAALATIYTFAPSFMMILAFAPAVEHVSSIAWARRALAGISAAVVGVIANLAVYLGEAAFFPSGLAEPDVLKLAIFVAALALVLSGKVGVLWLVAGGAVTGLGAYAAGLA